VQWSPLQALLLSGSLYVIWQLLYWKFVLIDRREKIESGQRTTSFTFLLNDKRGVIGKALSALPTHHRIAAFMGGQLVYMVLTELPVVYLLYNSALWSGVFLIFIFAVSVWNGGGFYIEVFGRKYVFCSGCPLELTMMSDCVFSFPRFEKELEALRRELAEATRSGRSSPQSSETLGTISASTSDDGESLNGSPVFVETRLPSIGVESASEPTLPLEGKKTQ
jgi:hypothetical protein